MLEKNQYLSFCWIRKSVSTMPGKSHTTPTPSLIHEMRRGNILVHYMNSNQAIDYYWPLVDDT